MKIGIVTSGVDMLVLFRFLTKYNFQYEIAYDDLGWPWADKPLEFVKERSAKMMDHLIAQGCEKIIVSPLLEVAFHHDKKHAKLILPLWNDYLFTCLENSPIGNIGFAGEYLDIEHKELFQKVAQEYKLNEVQHQRAQQIQKKKPEYTWTLNFRWHEIVMWKYYLTKLSFKSQIVHHAMKADWRYFKDSGADTIVPTSYGFFAYETILGKFLNTKKQRFHRLAEVEKAFDKLVKDEKAKEYSMHISYTGTLNHLVREKKWMMLLQKGKETSLESTHIVL